MAAGENANPDMVKLHLAQVLGTLRVTSSFHKACWDGDNSRRSALGGDEVLAIARNNIVAFKRRILLRLNHGVYSIKVSKFFFWILLLSYGVVAKKVSNMLVLLLIAHWFLGTTDISMPRNW